MSERRGHVNVRGNVSPPPETFKKEYFWDFNFKQYKTLEYPLLETVNFVTMDGTFKTGNSIVELFQEALRNKDLKMTCFHLYTIVQIIP